MVAQDQQRLVAQAGQQAQGGRRDRLALPQRRLALLQILTGRRASEIRTCDFDCLSAAPSTTAAADDDHTLSRFRYAQSKIDVAPDTILVDHAVTEVIAEQHRWIHAQHPGSSRRFLFTRRLGNRRGDKPYPAGTYNWVLRTLSDLVQITDAKGNSIGTVQSLDGDNAVVVDGGEPLRQNIAPLCEALLAKGYHIQIETNGTLWRELPQEVLVVCSPKNTGQGYFPVRPDVLSRAHALKFIISAGNTHYNAVAELGQSAYSIPVYIQPMDEHDALKNTQNLAFTLALAKQHGYRLSLQTHKLLGIE